MGNDVARLSPIAPISRIDVASPVSSSREGEASGFQSLDAIARDASSCGFVSVRAPHGSLLETIAVHVARRAKGAGRPTLRVGGLPLDDAFRELAARLGIAAIADPITTAESLIAKAQGAVIVVLDARPTAWGRAVAEEIARLLGGSYGSAASSSLPLQAQIQKPLFVHVSEGGALGAAPRSIDVGALASADDVRTWWEAASREAESSLTLRPERLDALEGWWSAARALPRSARPALDGLSEEAARLLANVAWSRRSWSWDAIERIGSAEARAELIARGALEVDPHGRLVSGATASALIQAESAELRAADAGAIAEALEATGRADPWALMRASELRAMSGDLDRAESAAERAIVGVGEATARADFWGRWAAALEGSPASASPETAARLLRAADLAHRLGDVERSISFANAALARTGDSYDALLAKGRATAARGDLTTAALILGRAIELAPDAPAKARAAVEMAEVRYLARDRAEARAQAEQGLEGAPDLATRLLARNVIGKLLLAEGKWDDAERHFAADAYEAHRGGDIVAELRARLNRGIALLKQGRYDESRAMLADVLEDGEAHGEHNAIVFALTNLAAIARFKHEYGEALELSEKAFEVRRRTGDKLRVALVITNLAELRVQIGLIQEAEEALAFGRSACKPGIDASRAAHFALVAARIHLARGNTQGAVAEVKAAKASATSAHASETIGECHRVAARIALEDGDLARADEAIKGALSEVITDYARVELAVLEAMLLRASGRPFRDATERALALAKTANDAEFAREAHTLMHHAATIDGDVDEARAHLDAALRLRRESVERLPEALRPRFLARRALAELAQIERAIAAEDAVELGASICQRCGQASCVGCGRRASIRGAGRVPEAPALKRMVGRDPSMMALVRAIQKVGETDATVLIHGESGTGKELVAEAVHEASPRRAGPLVKVNCAALVETLLLSELFGHEKGSFTGAMGRRRGRFELAEGGTLFLDEIGDISPRTQVALLRVLQDRTYERVGGATPLRANVRIVCATNRDLAAMVQRGEFREDLYYRLRGFVLEVPALRKRTGDLPLLAKAVLDRIAAERGEQPKALSASALVGLAAYSWPGNVRELENALRAATVFAEGDTIELDDLSANVEGLSRMRPPSQTEIDDGEDDEIDNADRASGVELRGSSPESGSARPPASFNFSEPPPSEQDSARGPTDIAYAHVRAGTSLSDLKRNIELSCIKRALAESNGNITRAAALLGMKRPRLSQLVKQYGLSGVSED